MSIKGSELEGASEVKTSEKHTGKKIDLITKILEDRESNKYWR